MLSLKFGQSLDPVFDDVEPEPPDFVPPDEGDSGTDEIGKIYQRKSDQTIRGDLREDLNG